MGKVIYISVFILLTINSYCQDSISHYFNKQQEYKDYSYKGEDYKILEGLILNVKKIKFKETTEKNIYGVSKQLYSYDVSSKLEVVKWKQRWPYLQTEKIALTLSIFEDTTKEVFQQMHSEIVEFLTKELEIYPDRLEKGAWTDLYLAKGIYKYKSNILLFIQPTWQDKTTRYIYWHGGKCIIIDCGNNKDDYNCEYTRQYLNGVNTFTEYFTKGGLLFSIEGNEVAANHETLITTEEFLEILNKKEDDE